MPMDREKEEARRIGRRIAEARREKGMSQAELATRMSISFQAVSRWERGESMPEITRLRLLSELLGITVDELLRGEEQDSP